MTWDSLDNPPQRPAPPASRSPCAALWDELERLHAALRVAPPTATLTVEDLQAEVERLRAVAAEQGVSY